MPGTSSHTLNGPLTRGSLSPGASGEIRTLTPEGTRSLAVRVSRSATNALTRNYCLRPSSYRLTVVARNRITLGLPLMTLGRLLKSSVTFRGKVVPGRLSRMPQHHDPPILTGSPVKGTEDGASTP